MIVITKFWRRMPIKLIKFSYRASIGLSEAIDRIAIQGISDRQVVSQNLL
jgi:hypothetical protein